MIGSTSKKGRFVLIASIWTDVVEEVISEEEEDRVLKLAALLGCTLIDSNDQLRSDTMLEYQDYYRALGGLDFESLIELMNARVESKNTEL